MAPRKGESLEDYRKRNREREAKRRASLSADVPKYDKAWREANPEKARFYKNNRLYREHGITLEEKEALIEEQDGLCGICQKPEGTKTSEIFCVDHDHETMRIVTGKRLFL